MSNRQRGKDTSIGLETCQKFHDLVDPLDEFQSALILAYEGVLAKGVRPSIALAVMLEFTSTEMQRLNNPPKKAVSPKGP